MTGRKLLLVLALLAVPGAVRAQHLIQGKKLIVKDPTGSEPGRAVVALGKETATDIGSAIDGDPTVNGAILHVIANGTTDSDQAYVLDATGWTALSTGYKYAGPTEGDADPVKKVILKRTPGGTALLKVLLKGSVGVQPLGVVPPNTGTDGGLILTINGGGTYCVGFGGGAGGSVTTDTAQLWKMADATGQGCPQSAAPVRYVFVSSNTSTGNLGGLSGADTKCTALAIAAGVPGAYKAWLSDSSASPSTRFTHASVPYILVNNTTIANNWTDLTDGTLAAPIDRTESGAVAADFPWTDTREDGTYVGAGYDCSGWTDGTSGSTGIFGDTALTNTSSGFGGGGWSFNYLSTCDGETGLYCFQQ